MAVYTVVDADTMAALIARYGIGTLVSAKGIAEGVENSNYLLDTTGADNAGGRFILTLYEKRMDPAELPFFVDLLTHLKARGVAVPAFLADSDGQRIQTVCGRPACLIEFLPGLSVTHPTAPQAHAVGDALGVMHRALDDFGGSRANALGIAGWRPLAERIGAAGFDAIAPGLADCVARELDFLDAHWPTDLPRTVIHADLFPDNVLMRGDAVSGLIDFYFAATDIRAYDLAVTHSAWCFSPDGRDFDGAVSAALVDGYAAAHPLLPEELAVLPVLARGSCLRFLLTRAHDWVNTPPDALVTRKDPLAFKRRLDFYSDPAHHPVFG